MRNVIFVAPFAFEATARFIEAAATLAETRLILASQDPIERFPAGLQKGLAGHWRVGNALDPGQLAVAVEAIAGKVGPIHRLLGTLEQLQVPLAEVREQLGIEGMGVEAASNFRDKARMKTVLRAAGIPCARHALLERADDARSFIAEVGYPIVVKPPAGSGAKGTLTIEDDGALASFLERNPAGPGSPILAEEFVQGTEHSFDGVSIGGKLVWHSLTHYLPAPLEVVRNPWIQWCVLLPREVDDPAYDDVREVAAAALDALGMDTGVCHLEWFRRPDGSVAVSEVGARPGGAQISKLISYAHDTSFYRAWAQVMIDGTFEPPRREYAAGAAFLRGMRSGRVKAVHGLGEAQKDLGPLVVESSLPSLGQPSTSSYEGEGYVILRHRETAVVEKALRRLVSLVRLEMG